MKMEKLTFEKCEPANVKTAKIETELCKPL